MAIKLINKTKAESAPVLNTRLVLFKNDSDPLSQVTAGQPASNAIEPEDEFKSFYALTTEKTGPQIICPPYNPTTLEKLTQENNALMPCLDAMVTNVAGTGYVIEAKKTEDEAQEVDADQASLERVRSFFDQPWPGESWQSIVKKARRDIEAVGYCVIEVIRAANEEVAFARHVSAKTVRYVGLTDYIQEKVTMKRGGKEVTYTTRMRHRRFAQVIQGKPIYFKEFGIKRDLDKKTGQFAKQGERVSFQLRATEFIVIGKIPDVKTPYGVPCWISQLPSVLGSRKAEEHNLGFFDAGGVPPVLIMVHGGQLAEGTTKALNMHFGGANSGKHRAAIIEAHGGGSIDDRDSVKMTVERFGSERQQDSMFENYDKKCEERVRMSWRLPPLFTGKAQDYSYATAFASYTVAEAQVFKPEREAFDEVINLRLIPELDKTGTVRYRSLPLSVKDAVNQLKAAELAATTGAINNGELISTLNEIASMDMTVDDKVKDEIGKPMVDPLMGQSTTGAAKPGGDKPVPAKAPSPKSKSAAALEFVADDIMEALSGGKNEAVYKALLQNIGTMTVEDIAVLKGLIAMKTFKNIQNDPDGLSLLNGCSLHLLAAE
jgi:PBSX family phage portal protein